MRILLRPLSAAAIVLAIALPVLACMAIPRRTDNSQVEMHLTEQRALVYARDGKEHLILSVKYDGATAQFAWVIPTEQQPTIQVQKGAPFHELWRLTEILRRQDNAMSGYAGHAPGAAARPPVTVIERKVQGPYEMVVLKATQSGGLFDWLKTNGFGLNAGSRAALGYYVKKGWYFAAARIRPGGAGNQQIQQNLKQGSIAALHLAFKATELSYPLRVTTGNPGDSKMEIFVVGQGIQRPRMLASTQFHLEPSGSAGFNISGPPGLAASHGDFPTLRKMLPQGGTLYKFTGVLGTAARNRDMVFRRMATASR